MRTTKTARDLSQKGKVLLDVDYADADQAVLIWDQLDTHSPAPLQSLPARQSTAVA